MTHTSELLWEMELVVPPCHEKLEWKLLLKDVNNPTIWILEEHQSRLVLAEGGEEGNARSPARFKIPEPIQKLDLPVTVYVESVSPFSLAAMWRGYKEGLKLATSKVYANPDSKMDVGSVLVSKPCPPLLSECNLQNHEAECITDNTEDAAKHRADRADTPEELHQPLLIPATQLPELQNLSSATFKFKLRNRSVSVQDLVVLGSESAKPHGIPTAVDADKCLPGSNVKIVSSEVLSHIGDGTVDNLSRVASPISILDNMDAAAAREKDLPEAALPTAALQVLSGFDQILVPKERRRLAIIMVGLPARGKTFTAAKLTRYLRWLGHVTKHFNVGQYRRLKHGCNQKADFFRSDNQEGLDARNEVAALAMEDMLTWMQEGGQIGIFDATNSTTKRRKMLLKISEGKCKVIFLEILCNDRTVIDRNIRLKIQQSPDYVDMPDFEEALKDFKARLANYEKAYEPVAEGSFIKMIDTVGGDGGQLQINNIGGYLPGRILFFLVNTHTNPRPIFLTRPGESLGNIHARVGGDQELSETGEKYAKSLANFVNERLKSEQTASVWTSTLQRTISTARHLVGLPKVQWRALDDINAGVCDGMTYQEIKTMMVQEYEARNLDKLRYRYPRGESYLDVIQRLEPVIIELERQHSPVVIVAHQAVLRSLYGYFADKPVEQIPYIEIPLHTVIEIQMGAVGVEEKRYKLL